MTGLQDTDEVMDEIAELRARLEALSARVAPQVAVETIPEGELTVLVARVGEETVAFLHEVLEEVVPLPRLTPIPEAPAWVAGMLNLRGEMLPVIDVHGRLQRRQRELSVTDLVVICRDRDRLVGLIVQALKEVRTAAGEEVQEPPDHVPYARYLLGVMQWEGRPTLLLSLRQLIEQSDLPEEG